MASTSPCLGIFHGWSAAVFVVLFLADCTAQTVTCTFTADNSISKVYIDGADQTSSISGSLGDWRVKKQMKFSSTATSLSVQAADYEKGCLNGDFAIKCVSADSKWQMTSNSKTGWKVWSSKSSSARPPSVRGKAWYHTDYAPGPTFYTPRFGSIQTARRVIGVQGFCGGAPDQTENYWFFRYTRPVNCVGAWGGWGGCSKVCGTGSQSRTYSISRNAAHGGSSCPASNGQRQSRNCNTNSCPVNCVGYWAAGAAAPRHAARAASSAFTRSPPTPRTADLPARHPTASRRAGTAPEFRKTEEYLVRAIH
eukprot:COSAG01_NODE_11356_length_1952_cov_1.996762_1_plen_309_part_00